MSPIDLNRRAIDAAGTASARTPDSAARRRRARLWRRSIATGLAAGSLLAGCTGLETQQRKWIFQPRPATAEMSLEEIASFASSQGMESVWIEHRSAISRRPIRLHALWAPHEGNADAPVLLYLHGARRDVGSNTWAIRNMQALGFSVLAVDYRGFGNSTNELPSELGAIEDARAAWDWLAARYPERPRYVFGYSLGGAVAVQLAAELAEQPAARQPRGVILEATFTSIRDMFQTLRWGWLPISALITERFDSLDAIQRVTAPLLVVHGSDDDFVPARFGQALYERARAARKQFVLVEGGTHYSTNWRGAEQYRVALKQMFGVGG
ncbi:alpha/beta hydrolase [Piscinibacter koreensis]|uniref:Alpha/beta fold hydrolase n=1 Tax=Piscinibacter koreensis TaxID=2742824 RepID=A0A7Y6NJH0_9BURK|nr:alpha/beta fold hydrolase [Schlegelella koreensis]NUZ04244.1 alpha/beta fold hydrolase [Schlegelella koreensis]